MEPGNHCLREHGWLAISRMQQMHATDIEQIDESNVFDTIPRLISSSSTNTYPLNSARSHLSFYTFVRKFSATGF